TADGYSILGTANRGYHTNLQLSIDGDLSNMRLYFRDDDWDRYSVWFHAEENNTDLSDGAWHHMVHTYDPAPTDPADRFDLYIDTVPQVLEVQPGNDRPDGTSDFAYPMILGGWNSRGAIGLGFEGGLDEVAFYTRPLASAEVAEHYSVAVADQGQIVHLAAVVRGRETELPADPEGEVEILPESLEWVDEWDSFWVEIWGHTPENTSRGIGSFSLDLAYDTSLFTATEIVYGPAFDNEDENEQTFTIDDAAGLVDDLGASTTDGLGNDKHLLLARVLFKPGANDPGCPHNADGQYVTPAHGLGLALADVGVKLDDDAVAAVHRGGLPETDVWPVLYDVDDDRRIGFGDFAYLAAAFGQNVGDAGAEFAWACDFDRSGGVGFGDLAFFAENFPAVPGSPMVYPAEFPWTASTGRYEASRRSADGVPTEVQPAPQTGLAADASSTLIDRSEAVAIEIAPLVAALAWPPDAATAVPSLLSRLATDRVTVASIDRHPPRSSGSETASTDGASGVVADAFTHVDELGSPTHTSGIAWSGGGGLDFLSDAWIDDEGSEDGQASSRAEAVDELFASLESRPKRSTW
ncbi:MAG: LamG-like jellyroll fold domain-containing protein, partial [Planctomycetota bacterium]